MQVRRFFLAALALPLIGVLDDEAGAKEDVSLPPGKWQWCF